MNHRETPLPFETAIKQRQRYHMLVEAYISETEAREEAFMREAIGLPAFQEDEDYATLCVAMRELLVMRRFFTRRKNQPSHQSPDCP